MIMNQIIDALQSLVLSPAILISRTTRTDKFSELLGRGVHVRSVILQRSMLQEALYIYIYTYTYTYATSFKKGSIISTFYTGIYKYELNPNIRLITPIRVD